MQEDLCISILDYFIRICQDTRRTAVSSYHACSWFTSAALYRVIQKTRSVLPERDLILIFKLTSGLANLHTDRILAPRTLTDQRDHAWMFSKP